MDRSIVFSFGIVVVCGVLLIAIFSHVADKQEEDKKTFFAECLKDKKNYECEVLWSQTDASKQVRDAEIGAAVGAAIGAAASRR